MNTRVEADSRSRELLSTGRALFQLTKPGVTRLVFATTLFGAVLAPGAMDLWLAWWTVLGTLLIVASANALNMYIEHEVDALMERTRERPLPSGRLSREVALGFGLLLGVTGLGVLGVYVNPLTCGLGAAALISYVCIYTPLKAKTPWALQIGAIPGAMPPVLGYTGLAGHLDLAALSLFAVLFTWQLPHFLAISVFRRAEYARAGLRVLPVVHGLERTRREVVGWTVFMVLASLSPWLVGVGSVWYLVGALVTGLGMLALALRSPELTHLGAGGGVALEAWSRRVFFASMPYLVVLFGLLAVSAT